MGPLKRILVLQPGAVSWISTLGVRLKGVRKAWSEYVRADCAIRTVAESGQKRTRRRVEVGIERANENWRAGDWGVMIRLASEKVNWVDRAGRVKSNGSGNACCRGWKIGSKVSAMGGRLGVDRDVSESVRCPGLRPLLTEVGFALDHLDRTGPTEGLPSIPVHPRSSRFSIHGPRRGLASPGPVKSLCRG